MSSKRGRTLVPSDRTHWKGTRGDTHSSAHSVRLPGEKATAGHLEQGASSTSPTPVRLQGAALAGSLYDVSSCWDCCPAALKAGRINCCTTDTRGKD